MMATNNLLVELFVEELPPKSLNKLGDAFASALLASLQTQGLAAPSAVVTPYATPRRLAVHITSVAAQAAEKSVSQKLMPASVGFGADGQPSAALLKKLASLGAGPEAAATLRRAQDGKAEALFFDSVVAGASLQAGLQLALDEAMAKLPILKRTERKFLLRQACKAIGDFRNRKCTMLFGRLAKRHWIRFQSFQPHLPVCRSVFSVEFP